MHSVIHSNVCKPAPLFDEKSFSWRIFFLSETAARNISEEEITAFKNYLVLRLCFGTYQRPTVLVSLKIRDVIDQPDGETSHLTVAKGQEVLIKTVMSHKTTTTESYSNVLKPLINIRWEIPCELIKWVFYELS